MLVGHQRIHHAVAGPHLQGRPSIVPAHQAALCAVKNNLNKFRLLGYELVGYDHRDPYILECPPLDLFYFTMHS